MVRYPGRADLGVPPPPTVQADPFYGIRRYEYANRIGRGAGDYDLGCSRGVSGEPLPPQKDRGRRCDTGDVLFHHCFLDFLDGSLTFCFGKAHLDQSRFNVSRHFNSP